MVVSEFYQRSAVVLILAALVATCYGSPYQEEEVGTDDLEEYDNNLDRFLQPVQDKRGIGGTSYIPMRRSCIRRGGNCDNRPDDCCYNSTCRCNLWGSNCKCQRMGLFQKWGK